MEYNYAILKDKDYLELCKYFLSLAKDDETRDILKKILFDGCVDEYILSSGLKCHNNYFVEEARRVSMAYLFYNNPEVFKFFMENNINIFHGTDFIALPNISKHGVGSVDYLAKKDVEVKTGEAWSRLGGGRSYVSFSDVLEIAQGYASLFSFEGGVLICTNVSEIEKCVQVAVHSDVSEIDVLDSFPLSGIKCICVGEDNLDTAKLFVGDSIPVFGLKNLEKKFYYYDFAGFLEFYPKEYEKFISSLGDVQDTDSSGFKKFVKKFFDKDKKVYEKK